MCMELSTSLSASPDQRLKCMQQEKAVFCRTQLKSPPGQQQCREYNFQPGLLLVSTWVCALTLGWSVSSRVQGQQTMCKYQNWPHSAAHRCGTECINQGRPGYGVHGLSHKGTLGSAAFECFPCWLGNVNNCVTFVVPFSPEREKQVYGSICFLLYGFLCCNFDLFW